MNGDMQFSGKLLTHFPVSGCGPEARATWQVPPAPVLPANEKPKFAPSFSAHRRCVFPIILFSLLGTLAAFAQEPSAPLAPTHLRCEGLVNPLGIDHSSPRFSWWVNDSRPNAMQSAWRIEVTGEVGVKWDSGKTLGSNSVDVAYVGPTLVSRERCSWRVMTWDAAGAESPWSEVAWFEMGLLKAEDWQASWIGQRCP